MEMTIMTNGSFPMIMAMMVVMTMEKFLNDDIIRVVRASPVSGTLSALLTQTALAHRSIQPQPFVVCLS